MGQLIDQRLIDFTGEHHLSDLGRLAVSHTQSVTEDRLLAQLVKGIGDLRAAAVNQYDLDTDQGQEHDVLHDLLFEGLVDHGVAAVFDDDDLAVIFLNQGKCLCEHLGTLSVGNRKWHGG